MKWTRVDHYTQEPIKREANSWHIVDYISEDFRICDDCGRWILRLRDTDELIKVCKTLKEAKAIAEARRAER